jgi:hypothetical protein
LALNKSPQNGQKRDGMFFTYDQNNSGGSFSYDPKAGISEDVVIEAASADDANERARNIGLYFDGCNKDIDCSCCGDRWHAAYGKGTERPEKYGKEIIPNSNWSKDGTFDIKWIKDGPSGYIHYLDGRVVPFGL